jgi:hypothetical protein
MVSYKKDGHLTHCTALFKITVICITRPDSTLLRVRVRFAGRGDSRGLQMRVGTRKTVSGRDTQNSVPTSPDIC